MPSAPPEETSFLKKKNSMQIMALPEKIDQVDKNVELVHVVPNEILPCSLFRLFLFLIIVAAITVFLQDVYFNFQDEKKVI